MTAPLKILLTLSIICSAYFAEAGRYGSKIELQEALRVELDSVLSAASSLQKACFEQSKRDIKKKTTQVITRLESASKRAVMAQVQATHLRKILEAAKEKLMITQNVEGKRKKENLAGAFKDLVQIAQVFDVGPYKVYFCKNDKSIWLQSDGGPQNPINPTTFGTCGRLVQ